MHERFLSLPLKTKLNVHYIACALGAVITMLGCYISKPYTLHFAAWLGLALIAAGLVWRILYIKCPHCGSGLYGCRVLPKHCPDCGKELE